MPSKRDPLIFTIGAAFMFLFVVGLVGAQELPCEPQKMAFKVEVERSAPAPVVPPSKALVYVAVDITAGNEANLAVDGQPVGGARNHTYFYFFLDPGEHHLCGYTRLKMTGVCRMRLSVAAGETHYLELNFQGNRGGMKTSLRLQPLDPDQGAEMLRHLKYSRSTPRT